MFKVIHVGLLKARLQEKLIHLHFLLFPEFHCQADEIKIYGKKKKCYLSD